MSDVDSLLDELDGLMGDDSRPSTGTSKGTPPATGVGIAPPQARGRGPLTQLRHDEDNVEEDIDSLLASLGGDDAFDPKSTAPPKPSLAARPQAAAAPPRRDLSAAPLVSSAAESSSYTCKYAPRRATFSTRVLRTREPLLPPSHASCTAACDAADAT